jgi:hypothetical protein
METLATHSAKICKVRLSPGRYDDHFDGNAHRVPTK